VALRALSVILLIDVRLFRRHFSFAASLIDQVKVGYSSFSGA
jgi:hypothetical protein